MFQKGKLLFRFMIVRIRPGTNNGVVIKIYGWNLIWNKFIRKYKDFPISLLIQTLVVHDKYTWTLNIKKYEESH